MKIPEILKSLGFKEITKYRMMTRYKIKSKSKEIIDYFDGKIWRTFIWKDI